MPKPIERKAARPRPEHDSPTHFQYLGQTGLTVLGPSTRKRYRFASPGAVVAVDPKDKRALDAVPTLRQVSKSTNVPKKL